LTSPLDFYLLLFYLQQPILDVAKKDIHKVKQNVYSRVRTFVNEAFRSSPIFADKCCLADASIRANSLEK